ncbi:MAG: flagellar hook-basal body complex protein, partial [Planctomycetota bacterium]|nr:flagellar hook-basal body complex protein [Planctomycetota bacterium]
MGLSQSLYTGYSGMSTHQRSLDNTGNNLANINTVGFKKSEFLFSNLFAKAITGATPEEDTHGSYAGINVGLGTTTGAILNNYRQGPVETTGNPLDVAISGNGFFIVQTSYGTALTRNGSFYLDHTVNPRERLLCVGDGLLVQGWMAENGVVTPSQTIGRIAIPAIGDILPGQVTSRIDLAGILPSNQSGGDFNGAETASMELKGNLQDGENRIRTSIFASISESGGASSAQARIEEVHVEIVLSGPTLSADGAAEQFSWSMATVDWPKAGDPPVLLYPTGSGDSSGAEMIGFLTADSTILRRGAGQATGDLVRSGSIAATSVTTNAEGAAVTAALTLAGGLTLDVSRLTRLANAPGDGTLETWHVDGNPQGSMARTVTIYDEYTAFVESTDADGNTVYTPERRVQARENTLFFSHTGAGETGSEWAWRSSVDGASGALLFNTAGDLVSATQPQGGIVYGFGSMRNINYQGSLQAASQDGYFDGYLQDITIDQNGKIFGHYSNNVSEVLAMLAMGTVPNPSGLQGVSGTLFYAS